jgi:preprotein translocase subunit SecG
LIALVTVIHVVVSVFLILVILLQAGKGGGMGAAFGGAGSQTVFGGRGAQPLLGKVTTVAAAIFMITSLALSYQSSRSRSVLSGAAAPPPAPAQESAPEAPAAPPAPGGAPAEAPAAPAQPAR